MNLSTIIVTWNSEGFIDKCLSSLINNCYLPNQIVVVDNGSVDNTIEEVKKWQSVELIENKENLGIGMATCQAYDRCNGDYILVSNPDIEFTGINQLIYYALQHPEMECMNPALEGSDKGVYGKPEKAVHWHRYPHFMSFSIGVILDNMLGHFLTKYCINYGSISRSAHPEAILDDKHVYGMSCILMKRSMIERIGGIYKPEYFWAWADADWGMRIAKYGCKGTGVPEALMKHYGGYSAQKLSSNAKFYLSSNGQKKWEKTWGHSTRYFILLFLDTIFVTAWKRGRIPQAKLMTLKGWVS